ncbi:MAG TPA: PDZ domain-containing protein, partial [Saprospiraceae bacterium]|nr:PDZ domain-containing protein [Saprospiraceae bacterium]
MRKLFLLSILVLCYSLLFGQTEARLLRFPTVSAETIVFSYSGDLYSVSRAGGIARKLTTAEGNEIFARFSPDEKTLAFTGQYDGNTEVYSMPSGGGVPVRLTYSATLGRDDLGDRMGPNNIVMSWKPDNSGVVYRSRKKSFNDFKGQLYIASMTGGMSSELPFSVGGFCSYSPDQKKLAMNQVFREFRTWKYYRGGMADDIWIYDFASGQMENITNNPAQDIFPMWHGDKIYFCSDRDRTMNLFVYDIPTKQVRKVTNFTDYDMKFPSLGKDAIVFEKEGYIYLFDIATEKTSKVTIIISDDAVAGRNEIIDASAFIEGNDFDLGPDGNRMTATARGDIWTMPAKEGYTRNLTKSSGVHERAVTWSPDGKYLAYISDASGEDEIYIQKQDGSEAAIRITKDGDTYKYSPQWSPDGKKLLWDDNKLRIFYVDISTKQPVLIDQSHAGEFRGANWSPDSKWITYTKVDDDLMSVIYLYDVLNKKSHPATDHWYDSYGGVFSPDGKYLFLISDRDFTPTYSRTEWNHSYSDMSKVYLITLAKSTPSPLSPLNDEVVVKVDSADVTSSSSEAKKKTPGVSDDSKKKETTPSKTTTGVTVKIDLEGIKERIMVLPGAPGNYFNLNTADDLVYFMTNATSAPKTTLKGYNLKDKKEFEIGQFNNYVISADRKKMLLKKDDAFAIVDLPKDKVTMDKKVDLSNMKLLVDRKKEWEQIFNEAWRQMRDFFYDPGMHGVDWAAMKAKYQTLLPYVNSRLDLTYIIGEMIAELSVGHAYVGGGDTEKADRIQTGLLGAELSRDASGYFHIDKVLKGENWISSSRSPLTEIGVNANEGDYILEVNGISTASVDDIYELLLNTAGKTTELTVNNKPEKSGSHKTLVLPVSDESDLYYLKWVRHNIDYVNDKTNGQVGYLHIPDMGANGLNEFVKYFYPQIQKKALIIDDRGNGGGNVSPQIIERLNREPVFINAPRNVTTLTTDPTMVFGPKVLLIDQYSASDGDIFPYRF